MARVILDLSDLEARAKRNLDTDWLERIQFTETGAMTYASVNGQVRTCDVFPMADGTLEGECDCPSISHKEESSTVKPCKHIIANIYVLKQKAKPKEETTEEAKEEVKPEVKPEADKREPVPTAPYLRELRLNPSSAPAIEECAAFLARDKDTVLIETSGDAGKIGRAAHDICENLVQEGWKFPPPTEGYAMKHDVPEAADDLKYFAWFAIQAWHGSPTFDGIKQWFGNPLTEKAYKFKFEYGDPYHPESKYLITISGRMDLVEVFPDEGYANVGDWKSGYKREESNYPAQMKMGAFLVAAQDKRIKRVNMSLIWLRDRVVQTVTMTREELREWMMNLLKYRVFWDGKTYGPGDACTYCVRFAQCPGRAEQIESTARALATIEGELMIPLLDDNGEFIPERTYPMYAYVKLVHSATKAWLDAFKERLDGQVVPVPSKEGMALAVVETKGGIKIDPQTAWPILSEHLTGEQLASIITISAGKMDDEIASTVDKGQKGKQIEAIRASLEAAGAVSFGESRKSIKVVKLDSLK